MLTGLQTSRLTKCFRYGGEIGSVPFCVKSNEGEWICASCFESRRLLLCQKSNRKAISSTCFTKQIRSILEVVLQCKNTQNRLRNWRTDPIKNAYRNYFLVWACGMVHKNRYPFYGSRSDLAPTPQEKRTWRHCLAVDVQRLQSLSSTQDSA